jgi:N-sulfoglucosamine sulfohydrolase
MRCVQNRRFGYIFNPWSDGERVFKNESQSGLTFNAMKAAENNPTVAARVKLFQYRVLEEFYDFKNDPDALHNLIDDAGYTEEIDALRNALLEWMKRTDDAALEAFANRTSPAALRKFMVEQDTRAGKKKPKKKANRRQRSH